MLYTIEFGQPCQQWGCPQMESAVPREIIPLGPCWNSSKYKCNCCYDCMYECCKMRDTEEYFDEQ